jgi:hypothetical protein
VHVAVFAVVASVEATVVSQSQTHEVTAGAPLSGVTVAVNVVGVPVTTDVGKATIETVYDGCGGVGGGIGGSGASGGGTGPGGGGTKTFTG